MRPAGLVALFVASIAGVEAQPVTDCFNPNPAQTTAAIGTSTMDASPAALTFSYVIGSTSPPALQLVTITPFGIRFTETASTSSGGNWLRVCPVIGAAPGPIVVGIDPSSLPVGIYNGSISVASFQTSNSVTIKVTLLILPAITISSIAPSSVAAGGADFILTVTGNNFQNTSKVCWNNTQLDTSYFNPMLLTAVVPASLIATPGVVNIGAGDPIEGGGCLSNILTFTIDPSPPAISISPAAVPACGPGFTLTITGTGFRLESIVLLNGSPLPTTFVNTTLLTATVSAALISATAGSAEIVVINPGNVVSNKVPLLIVACPVIASLDPATVVAGGQDFILTITGSGFGAGSVAMWNGQTLQTLSATGTQIRVLVPALLIATGGCASIIVRRPDGGSSAPFEYCVPPCFSGPFLGLAGPSEQPLLDFRICAKYSLPIAVTATLTFMDNAIASADDPMIRLSSPTVAGDVTQRILKFTIPPDSTAVPTIMVQTGTVAGIIAIDVVAQAPGSNPYAGKVAITIPRSAPVIRGSSLTFTPTGFEVAITGFSPERAMEKAFFHFNAPAGSNQFPDITIDVAAIFAAYYQDASSKPFGSVFTYKQAFTLEDAASAIKSVTVRLRNSIGESDSSTTP